MERVLPTKCRGVYRVQNSDGWWLVSDDNSAEEFFGPVRPTDGDVESFLLASEGDEQPW